MNLKVVIAPLFCVVANFCLLTWNDQRYAEIQASMKVEMGKCVQDVESQLANAKTTSEIDRIADAGRDCTARIANEHRARANAIAVQGYVSLVLIAAASWVLWHMMRRVPE